MAKKLTVAANPQKKNLTGGFTDSELLQMNKGLKEEIEALKENGPEWWDPMLLPTRSPFKDLFPIQVGTLSDIVDDMKVRGFDPDYPILLGMFPDGYAVVDGHTRTAGAINAEIELVPVIKREFSSDQEALDYAIHLQRDRRNITDSELFTYIKAVDQLKSKGRKEMGSPEPISSTSEELGSTEPDYTGRSADRTAELTGTSATKVKKARAIEREGSEELKEQVRTGKKSINSAYGEVKEKREKDGGYIPLPKIHLAGETLLNFITDLESEIQGMEENYLFNYGRFIGVYNLILTILPVDKLTDEKWKSIGGPLLRSFSRVQDDAKRREQLEV